MSPMKCPVCCTEQRLLAAAAALFLLQLSSRAQGQPAVFLENYVSLDTAIMIADDNLAYSPQIACCNWNEWVYISDYYTSSRDSLDVYKLNTHTYGLEKLRFVFEGMSSVAMRENYSGLDFIACNDSLFVAAIGTHLYIAPWHNSTHFKHIVLHNSYQSGQFDKHGNLVLYRYYYGNKTPTELSIYNIEKQTVVKTVYPEGGNMLVSYIGGTHLFDVHGENIIFARPNEFQIDVYDLSLNKKNSVAFADSKTVIEPALWKQAQKLPRHAASDRIDMFSPFDYDLMLWTYLCGDNIVAVYRTKSGTNEYSLHTMLNVFEYGEDSSWNPVLVDAIDRMRKEKNEIITRSTVPVNWVGGNSVLFAMDKIVAISTNGTLGSPVGMTMAQFDESKRKWLQAADFRMQVNIFSFNF